MIYEYWMRPQGGERMYGPIKLDINPQMKNEAFCFPTPAGISPNVFDSFRAHIARAVGWENMVAMIEATFGPGSIGVEIGVDTGDGCDRLLRANPGKLYLVDPWKTADYDSWFSNDQNEMDARYDKVCKRFIEQTASGLVEIHRSYSSDFLLSGIQFDWVYIDGDHREDSVCSDILLSYECMGVGGLIFGDDMNLCYGWNKTVRKGFDRAVAQLGNKIEILNEATDPFIIRILSK